MVWQRQVPGSIDDFRLVINRDGTTRDASIDRFDHRIDPDVGPNEKNRIVAVYARCDNPTSYANPDCGIFEYDVKSGDERRVKKTLSKEEEYAPSVWGGHYTFGRTRKYHVGTTGFPFELDTNDPQAGKGAGLFSNESKLSGKPLLDSGDDVYWLGRFFPSDGSTATTQIFRRNVPSKRCKHQSGEERANLTATSMAVDNGKVYYTDGTTGVMRADPSPF